MLPRAAGALLAALLLGGCGASAAREDGAADAGRRFAAALSAGDYRTGCALLAPDTREQVEEDGRTPCRTGLREAGLATAVPVRAVAVYGQEAQLRMTGDTVFLSRFDGGWLVTAAGCEARGADEPYRCAVQGGLTACGACSSGAWC
ncbi:hypothetical protein [Streptomyces filamentosus]|uniref:hypothetical protein n=2 Tax=Streptomyces filamentosus TaxID=67294 RepID=UPI001239B0C2|nr:hypothetical protein [Streptomyces filamentosus]KAA6210937.1 hypothetical protein CP979_31095 [Streptomyces filamentosus]